MKFTRNVLFVLAVAILAGSLPVSQVVIADDPPSEAAKTEEVKAEEKPAAEAKKENEDDKEATERKTHKVEAKPLKITADVEGVFAARETSEIILRPEEWSEFKIEEVVPHGTVVAKGEVLIKFDSKKLEEAIADLEMELRLGELAMIRAEQELPRATEQVQRDFDQAKRAYDEAQADYDYYRNVDRELSLKSAEMNLKQVKQYTENAREELRQLEKMYEADDLTEETEEIILKRQRAEVEQADFYLETYLKSYDQAINVYIPRRDVQEKQALDNVKLAFERAKTALETDQTKQKYENEQQKDARREALEKHAKLLADRSLMEIRSPADGVVCYGGATNGDFSETASLIQSLRKHGSAATESVVMTIVKPRPLYVIGTVGEDVRPSIKPGQIATVTSAATDETDVEGKLDSVSSIPVGDKKYRVELSVESGDLPDWIVAGLTAKAKITTYSTDQALLVPKGAVKTDDKDEKVKYVLLVDAADSKAEPKRQPVKVGKTKDDNLEIVDGLKAGDLVVLEDEAK